MRLSVSKDMPALRADAKARVDVAAEAARLLHITPGSGQSMEYEQTAREAESCLALIAGSGTPQRGDYPMLDAEQDALAVVGQTVTLQQVAEQVAGERVAWLAVGAEIKRLRRSAKAMIDAAATPAEIAAAEAVEWP